MVWPREGGPTTRLQRRKLRSKLRQVLAPGPEQGGGPRPAAQDKEPRSEWVLQSWSSGLVGAAEGSTLASSSAGKSLHSPNLGLSLCHVEAARASPWRVPLGNSLR